MSLTFDDLVALRARQPDTSLAGRLLVPRADEAGSAPAPTRETGSAGLGQDDFLTMLIAQLENQDPLNPQEATEFTAQLATFSMLERLVSIEAGIERMEELLEDAIAGQAAAAEAAAADAAAPSPAAERKP